MKHAGKWTALMILVAGAFAGCEAPPMPAKPMPMPAPVPKTRIEMTQALVQEDGQFGPEVARMPGFSAEDHRQALVMLLDRLPKILKDINGEYVSPEFKNRLSVILAARATVNDEHVERRRMEAVENQALQSAAPAFATLAGKYLYDDKDLPPLLSNLDAAISAAAFSVGPMHDLDATNAFVALQAVVERFTVDLVERFSPDAGPTPAPTPDQTVTPPATAPATPAATEPAMPPATPTTDSTTTPTTAPTTDPTATPATPAATPTTDPTATPATPASAPTTSP